MSQIVQLKDPNTGENQYPITSIKAVYGNSGLSLEDWLSNTATKVSFTPTVLTGTKIGTLVIDDAPKDIYAPSVSISAGNRIAITELEDGTKVISSSYSYTLPTASSSVKGGIKIGAEPVLNTVPLTLNTEGKAVVELTNSAIVSGLGYTPANNGDITTNGLRRVLGISDWALAADKPSYTLSELDSDSTHRLVTDEWITNWNNKASAASLNTVNERISSLETFFEVVTLDNGTQALKAKNNYAIVSDSFVTGAGSPSTIPSPSFNRLDAVTSDGLSPSRFPAYSSNYDSYLLSGALGYNLDNRVRTLEDMIVILSPQEYESLVTKDPNKIYYVKENDNQG